LSMFGDIPVDVGVIYEGERIRFQDMYVEMGGERTDNKFELVKIKSMDQVEDGKISVVGPDLKDIKEKSTIPFGIYIEVAGKQLEEGLESVVERRIHAFCNYVEGLMHLNQRYDIWLRLSKKSYEKGFNSFVYLGKVLQRLFKNELPIIEKIQISFLTDPAKVKEAHAEALKIYEARDSKARGLKDEEADKFYGCTLCQSFAPTHVCVITPQRYSNCGSISWFDARASARIDPKGPVFEVDKGELIDPTKGEFTGVNDVVKKKSLGEINRVWLYTSFGYPHTSCGCFEGVAFYIPEVEGFGVVHRGFKGATVNGLPFSTIADSTAGGRQVDGFHGLSIEYMRSTKFLSADGGWNRVVWMPTSIKERIQSFIPKDVADKIATENDVKSMDELKTYLKEHNHPVIQRWKAAEAQAMEAAPEVSIEESPTGPVIEVPTLPISAGGGFKIILKNAKIHAEKVIIRTEKTEKK
jgi:acetyl-CoA decarbonylase/synthase complex subunit beta